VDFVDAWHAVKRRLWLVVVGALIAGVAAYAYASAQTPMYKGEAQLLIYETTPEGSMFEEALPSISTQPQRIVKAHVAMAQTYEVAQETLDRMGLDTDPVDFLRDQVDVTGDNQASIVKITVLMEDPALAAETAQTMAEVHGERYAESRREALGQAIDATEQQLEESWERVLEYAEKTEVDEGEGGVTIEVSRLAGTAAYDALSGALATLRVAEANAENSISLVEVGRIYPDQEAPQTLVLTLVAAVAGALAGAVGAIIWGHTEKRPAA
jgi:uncharacterized protein involved in exopolysaccharide biosynthesis